VIQAHQQVTALHGIAVLFQHRKHDRRNFRTQIRSAFGFD
jgi:hypothetical protein